MDSEQTTYSATTAQADPLSERITQQAAAGDRKAIDSRNWQPEQLWAQWRRFCVECEKSDPPKDVLISAFQVSLGQARPILDFWAERGPEWAHVVKKIELDQQSRIEAKLIRGGHSQIGCIFWLKNKAGWRDKSQEEAKEDREDWLARVQANSGLGRDDAPPIPHTPLQPVDSQQVTDDEDTESRRIA